jgi:hypothetical protein
MAVTSLVLGILSFFCLALAGIPAIVFGFLGLSRAKTAGTGQGMAVAGMILGLVGTLLTGGAVWLVMKAYQGAERIVQTVRNEMEAETNGNKGVKVGLAAHNYHDAHGALPNPYGKQPTPRQFWPKGKEKPRPLLSWRVDLLPHLNDPSNPPQQAFKLDEPWDSPANRPLASRRIEPYVFGYDPPGSADTRWRGFTGLGTVFEPGAKVTLPGIKDGTSNTLFCAESAEAVGWTEPNNYPFTNPFREAGGGPKGPAAPLPKLGRAGGTAFLMLMCDGSVKNVRQAIDRGTLNKMIDREDGNVIPDGWEARGGD